MTNEQINAKVKELLTSLETHKNFLDSLNEEVVDVLNDSCYYVNGSIEQLETEIFEIENFLERGVFGDDDDWKSDEEREAFMKEWGPNHN